MTNTDVAGGSLYQSMWMFKSNVCAGSPTDLLFSRVRHVCVELLKNQRNDPCILENLYTVATSYLISRQRIYLPYKWRLYRATKLLQFMWKKFSHFGWQKTSTLIGCSVIWMTRSKGYGRGVLIKSHLWCNPNSACPVISLLTKNHYIRCQSGSILWQGEAFHSHLPLQTCALTANLKQQEGWGQRFVQISISIPAAKTGGITLRLLRQPVPARHH